MPHRVVILGGGFAGLNAAKNLRRAAVEITLVDKRNFHLFQPLLYQVATGGLSPGDIAAPLRAVLSSQRNVRVLMSEAVDLDAAGRRLLLGDASALEYDSLVVACGATHSYFGHPEWESVAPGLKTIEDATEIRGRILNAFEMAEREPDPETRRAWLTFVIVGAGPTGVELAGALGEVANDTLRHDFRTIRPQEARILLLDASDRVLSPFPPELSESAERQLIELNVRARRSVRVTGIDADGVDIDTSGGRERIRAKTVLWAAGVAGAAFGKVLASRAGAALDRAGRVVVASDLSVAGHPEIFVAGDLARCEQDGQLVPGVAPAAMQQGRYVARVIAARVEAKQSPAPFRYFDKGSMATIGRQRAVADIGPLHFGGLFAWLAWLFIHLMYLVGFENRVLVALQWGINYFTFHRGARLITGHSKT